MLDFRYIEEIVVVFKLIFSTFEIFLVFLNLNGLFIDLYFIDVTLVLFNQVEN